MKLRSLVFAVFLIVVNGPLALATHSKDGECGNGHLGGQEDCSGTSSGTTVEGAPAPTLGSQTGSITVLLLASATILVLCWKRSRRGRSLKR